MPIFLPSQQHEEKWHSKENQYPVSLRMCSISFLVCIESVLHRGLSPSILIGKHTN